jgi:hypothetical protein
MSRGSLAQITTEQKHGVLHPPCPPLGGAGSVRTTAAASCSFVVLHLVLLLAVPTVFARLSPEAPLRSHGSSPPRGSIAMSTHHRTRTTDITSMSMRLGRRRSGRAETIPKRTSWNVALSRVVEAWPQLSRHPNRCALRLSMADISSWAPASASRGGTGSSVTVRRRDPSLPPSGSGGWRRTGMGRHRWCRCGMWSRH